MTTNYDLMAFQRAAARRAITDMDGWVAVPEFVAAVSELDNQLRLYCQSKDISREQFYTNWINYLKARPIK